MFAGERGCEVAMGNWVSHGSVLGCARGRSVTCVTSSQSLLCWKCVTRVLHATYAACGRGSFEAVVFGSSTRRRNTHDVMFIGCCVHAGA
jgi:hypothetical protein